MKILTPVGRLCVLSAFTACFVWGQATKSAEVTGSLTDPSGTIVPGANRYRTISRHLLLCSGKHYQPHDGGSEFYHSVHGSDAHRQLRRDEHNLRSDLPNSRSTLHVNSAMPNFVVQEICGQIQPGRTGKIWQEWFGFPAMRMVEGRFPLPQKPGLGFDLTEESLAKYPFGGTRPMARVFHEDGSVAEW